MLVTMSQSLGYNNTNLSDDLILSRVIGSQNNSDCCRKPTKDVRGFLPAYMFFLHQYDLKYSRRAITTIEY